MFHYIRTIKEPNCFYLYICELIHKASNANRHWVDLYVDTLCIVFDKHNAYLVLALSQVYLLLCYIDNLLNCICKLIKPRPRSQSFFAMDYALLLFSSSIPPIQVQFLTYNYFLEKIYLLHNWISIRFSKLLQTTKDSYFSLCE